MKENVTVDPPKRVDAPRSILALLEEFSERTQTVIRGSFGRENYELAEGVCEVIARRFNDDVKPKLEAFLKDHVSRAQLKKHLKEFPDLDKPHASLPFESLLVWRAKVIEWRKRLEMLK